MYSYNRSLDVVASSSASLKDLVDGYFNELGRLLMEDQGGKTHRFGRDSAPLTNYTIEWNSAKGAAEQVIDFKAVFEIKGTAVFYKVFAFQDRKPKLLMKRTFDIEQTPAIVAEQLLVALNDATDEDV